MVLESVQKGHVTADWVHLCINDAARPRSLRLRLAALFKMEASKLAQEALLAGDLPPEATELLDAKPLGDGAWSQAFMGTQKTPLKRL